MQGAECPGMLITHGLIMKPAFLGAALLSFSGRNREGPLAERAAWARMASNETIFQFEYDLTNTEPFRPVLSGSTEDRPAFHHQETGSIAVVEGKACRITTPCKGDHSPPQNPF